MLSKIKELEFCFAGLYMTYRNDKIQLEFYT